MQSNGARSVGKRDRPVRRSIRSSNKCFVCVSRGTLIADPLRTAIQVHLIAERGLFSNRQRAADSRSRPRRGQRGRTRSPINNIVKVFVDLRCDNRRPSSERIRFGQSSHYRNLRVLYIPMIEVTPHLPRKETEGETLNLKLIACAVPTVGHRANR